MMLEVQAPSFENHYKRYSMCQVKNKVFSFVTTKKGGESLALGALRKITVPHQLAGIYKVPGHK